MAFIKSGCQFVIGLARRIDGGQGFGDLLDALQFRGMDGEDALFHLLQPLPGRFDRLQRGVPLGHRGGGELPE